MGLMGRMKIGGLGQDRRNSTQTKPALEFTANSGFYRSVFCHLIQSLGRCIRSCMRKDGSSGDPGLLGVGEGRKLAEISGSWHKNLQIGFPCSALCIAVHTERSSTDITVDGELHVKRGRLYPRPAQYHRILRKANFGNPILGSQQKNVFIYNPKTRHRQGRHLT